MTAFDFPLGKNWLYSTEQWVLFCKCKKRGSISPCLSEVSFPSSLESALSRWNNRILLALTKQQNWDAYILQYRKQERILTSGIWDMTCSMSVSGLVNCLSLVRSKHAMILFFLHYCLQSTLLKLLFLSLSRSHNFWSFGGRRGAILRT